MARTESKAVSISVAAGVLTFGVQQLTAGDVTTGALGIVIGLVLFVGYQYAEESDHAQAYNDVVDSIGEDTFERLAEMSADEIDDLLGGDGGE